MEAVRATGITLMEFSNVMVRSFKLKKIKGIYLTMNKKCKFVLGVWETSDPLAEFAVAVQVTAYPATAMSVWIYVASLIKRM